MNVKKIKRMISLWMAISLMAVCLYGCGNSNSGTDHETVNDLSAENEKTAESSEPAEELSGEDGIEKQPEITEASEEAEEEPETAETAGAEEAEEEPEAVETAEPESAGETEALAAETSEAAAEAHQEAPAYTYTDLSKVMYAQQSVNVRDLPSTDGNKLGALSLNQEVTVTRQCNETSWYRIEYNGAAAYVSSQYLGDAAVAAVQPETQSSQTGKYTVFYMENSGGTWYTTADGLTCDYYNNSMGCLVNEPAYTLEGLKATFLNIGEVIYNEDGSIKMLVCGCCASVYENYGIATFMEACNLAESMGYVFDHLGEDFTWVASTPNTWPHNLTWYYFVKK